MREASSLGSQASPVHLVSFASGEPFVSTQQLLDGSLGVAGLSSHARWTDHASLEQVPRYAAARARAEALSPRQRRRGGFWKPLLLLDKLDRVPIGAWVLFHDASQYIREPFRHDVRPLTRCLEHLGEDALVGVRTRGTLEWEYSQCGVYYGDRERAVSFCEAWETVACPGSRCCNRDLERQVATLLNTWHLWRNTAAARQLLEHWLDLCLSELSARVPLLDQSLLEILAAQSNLPTIWLPSTFMDSEVYPMVLYDEANLQKSINVVFDNLHVASLRPFQSVTGFEWSSLTTPAYLWRASLNCSGARKEALEPCWRGGFFNYRLCCGEQWGPGGNPSCWDASTTAAGCCVPRDVAVCIGGLGGLAVDENVLWETLVKPLRADIVIQADTSDLLLELEGMYPSAVAIVRSCSDLGALGHKYKRVLTVDGSPSPLRNASWPRRKQPRRARGA